MQRHFSYKALMVLWLSVCARQEICCADDPVEPATKVDVIPVLEKYLKSSDLKSSERSVKIILRYMGLSNKPLNSYRYLPFVYVEQDMEFHFSPRPYLYPSPIYEQHYIWSVYRDAVREKREALILKK